MTPRASVDTQLVRWLTPRSEPMQRATSSLSVHWPNFGPSANKTHNAIPFTKGIKSTPAALTSNTKLSDHPYLKRPAKRTTELDE
ncbi:hypothetical protein YC2023_117126 [Brassica napus]